MVMHSSLHIHVSGTEPTARFPNRADGVKQPAMSPGDVRLHQRAADVIHVTSDGMKCVQRGQLVRDDSDVFVKIFPITESNSDLRFHYDHPNIIKSFGYYVGDPPSCVAATQTTKRAPLGFAHLVLEPASKSLVNDADDVEKVRAVHHVLSALEFLHDKHGVTHRDIKPSNILKVGDQWKLGDFGIALHCDETTEGCRGSRDWTDPSLLTSGTSTSRVPFKGVDPRTDLYAVGQLLRFSKGSESVKQLEEESWASPPASLVQDLLGFPEALIGAMKDPDISKRPSAALLAAWTRCHKEAQIASAIQEAELSIRRSIDTAVKSLTESCEEAIADLRTACLTDRCMGDFIDFRTPLNSRVSSFKLRVQEAVTNCVSTFKDALVSSAGISAPLKPSGFMDLCRAWEDNAAFVATMPPAIADKALEMGTRVADTFHCIESLVNSKASDVFFRVSRAESGAAALKNLCCSRAMTRGAIAPLADMVKRWLRSGNGDSRDRGQEESAQLPTDACSALRDALVALAAAATHGNAHDDHKADSNSVDRIAAAFAAWVDVDGANLVHTKDVYDALISLLRCHIPPSDANSKGSVVLSCAKVLRAISFAARTRTLRETQRAETRTTSELFNVLEALLMVSHCNPSLFSGPQSLLACDAIQSVLMEASSSSLSSLSPCIEFDFEMLLPITEILTESVSAAGAANAVGRVVQNVFSNAGLRSLRGAGTFALHVASAGLSHDDVDFNLFVKDVVGQYTRSSEHAHASSVSRCGISWQAVKVFMARSVSRVSSATDVDTLYTACLPILTESIAQAATAFSSSVNVDRWWWLPLVTLGTMEKYPPATSESCAIRCEMLQRIIDLESKCAKDDNFPVDTFWSALYGLVQPHTCHSGRESAAMPLETLDAVCNVITGLGSALKQRPESLTRTLLAILEAAALNHAKDGDEARVTKVAMTKCVVFLQV